MWSRPEAVENTKYALQAGVDILNYFEEYFDFDYPLEKQGLDQDKNLFSWMV